ncbi:MAG: phosphoribosylglycinamide formyltransferase [Planctomycetes bacterium]|nr:phosphoribosylglycinamide formyltransferase [Planctomycetota bacterium]
MADKINLAVLLSGGGTTLQNIIDRIEAGNLDANVRVVISSQADAYGLERAKKHNIPSVVVSSKDFKNCTESFSKAIFSHIDKYPVDLVVMAGFMCLITIPEKYLGRVMNIHPALIPAFCGKGRYGHHVHEAVLEYGAKVSGCTVHFADNVYDHGPVIVQKTVPVFDDDTPDTLAARVFEQECEAYPEAIQLFAEGRLKIEGRKVRILK